MDLTTGGANRDLVNENTAHASEWDDHRESKDGKTAYCAQILFKRQHESGEIGGQCFVPIERKDLPDILIRSNDHHASRLPINSAHGKDIAPAFNVAAKHLLVVAKPVTSLSRQKQRGHRFKGERPMSLLKHGPDIDDQLDILVTARVLPHSIDRVVATLKRAGRFDCNGYGVQKILEHEGISVEGKNVTVVGASNIVGDVRAPSGGSIPVADGYRARRCPHVSHVR